jgi:hypothetical protein
MLKIKKYDTDFDPFANELASSTYNSQSDV